MGEIPDTIEIFEGKANFIIDLKGQKTDFILIKEKIEF